MKKIIISNLLIILIFFSIAEIFLNYFNLSGLKGYEKELIKKKKNIETIVFGKKVFIDKFGYRTPNNSFIYKENLRRIIFIGDSVLFGSGIDEEKTFVGKLRLENNNISFVNAGIIGNDIPEILFDIEKNNKLFPDSEFIIVLTLDDIQINKTKNDSFELNNNNNFVKKLKENYIINKINVFLRAKSYTYIWIKGIVTKPSERYFVENLNYYNSKKNINFFDEYIKKIKKIINSKKLSVKFIILPFEYQTRNQCNEKYLIPQKKINNIFEKNEIDLFDLTQNFCIYLNPKKLYLNFDPVHLSVKGHDLVFEFISREIN